jgi:hypothetical protein
MTTTSKRQRRSTDKAARPGEEIRFALGQSSLGSILVASSEKGVASVLIGGDPDDLIRDLQHRFAKANLVRGDRDDEDLVARVVDYVEAPARGLDLPLDLRARRSSNGFGKPCWRFPPAERRPSRMLRAGPGRQKRCEPLAMHARPATSPSPCLAIGCCTTTVRSLRVTAGGRTASTP